MRALRFRVPAGNVRFHDRRLGDYLQNVEKTVGDFVLKRADGLWAYQLAVVVDDLYQGVTDIVRGADLIDNTPRQILLTQALGAAPCAISISRSCSMTAGKNCPNRPVQPPLIMKNHCLHSKQRSNILDFNDWAPIQYRAFSMERCRCGKTVGAADSNARGRTLIKFFQPR